MNLAKAATPIFAHFWSVDSWKSSTVRRGCSEVAVRNIASKMSNLDHINVKLKSSLITVHSTVKDMKYTSRHCCDKTMDGKMALYRECCFPNCSKS